MFRNNWTSQFIDIAGSKCLDEAKIGDYIKPSNGDYTEVYGLSHFNPYQESQFIQLQYQSDTIPVFSYLEISPRHVDKLNGMIVNNIQIDIRQGLFAPLTYSVDFMVNEVIVSNYVDVLDHGWIWNQHTVGHIMFLPQRIFCSCFLDTLKNEKYIDGYGYLAYDIVRGLLIVQSMILLVTIALVACVFVVIWYLCY